MSDPRGWPDDWAERKRGDGCPLCDAGDPLWVEVARGAWTDVHVEPRSRIPGCCVVVWNGRHVAEPTELSAEEAAGFWSELVAVGRAIEAVFQPVKMNYLLLGTAVPHLHGIVVPRPAEGDPAPGHPVPWDALFGAPADRGVLDEHARLLRAALGWPERR
jgi:diadenosine tetraphosphate (Ap4A) HIT family hydrolase